MRILLCFLFMLYCHFFLHLRCSWVLLCLSRTLLISYAIDFRQCNFSRVHLNWLIRFYLIELFLNLLLWGIHLCWLSEMSILLLLISHRLTILWLLLLLSLLQIIIAHGHLILTVLVAIKHSVFLLVLGLLLLCLLKRSWVDVLIGATALKNLQENYLRLICF